MKHYTDLFIDFDDTLYDTHGNAEIALHELFQHYGWARYFADPEEFYADYWTTNLGLWTRYSRGEVTRDYLIVERFRHPLSLGKGLNPTEAYCRDVSDTFLNFCATKPGTIAGAHELMDYLQRRGYRMHLCSNGFHEVQYRKLRSCGLTSYFHTVILSEDAGANKPSRQFFDYAFRQSAAVAATTLMIGDNYNTDILGARNAGLDTLYFRRWPEVRTDHLATYEVDTLQEIMDVL